MPHDDDENEEDDDNKMEDNNEVENSDRDDNNFKDISSLGLDRDMEFSRGHQIHQKNQPHAS